MTTFHKLTFNITFFSISTLLLLLPGLKNLFLQTKTFCDLVKNVKVICKGMSTVFCLKIVSCLGDNVTEYDMFFLEVVPKSS